MTTTLMRLSIPFRKARGDTFVEPLPHPQAPEDVEDEGQIEEKEQVQNASAQAAHEWLEETIRQSDRWTEHLSQIRLECPYTMPELRQLGRLPRTEGVPKCQALIRVPVIYDEISLFVWMSLAEMELGGPGLGRETEEEGRRAAAAQQGRSDTFLATLDERSGFDRLPSSSGFLRPASATERDRARVYSPAVSPKGTRVLSLSSSPPSSKRRMSDNRLRDRSFGRQESIKELPEETHDEELTSARGRLLSRNGSHRVGFQEGETSLLNAVSRSSANNSKLGTHFPDEFRWG